MCINILLSKITEPLNEIGNETFSVKDYLREFVNGLANETLKWDWLMELLSGTR